MLSNRSTWRDTARSVRFGPLDARAMSGFAVWMLAMSWPTFWLSIAILALFFFLERAGITLPCAINLVRCGLFSNVRTHDGTFAERARMRDQGA